jgi:regulator of protease activity HflC (stomatin/prohibitin superfamily)
MNVLDLLTGAIWTGLFLYTGFKFTQCIRLVPNRKAYIVERLGKYEKTLEPGFHVLVPFFDKVSFIQDLREESIEVPPQDCFTRDNVRVEVDGVLYISVKNPESASYGVSNYRIAAILLAQTTTRSVIGTLDLDRTFEERDEINGHVMRVLGEVADQWGIKVHRYEIKNIVPPVSVRDAMERQMGAERHRRALLAQSEGQKMAMVNESEGRKQELINQSEGELRRRINEAEGKASELLAIAEATAESIKKLGGALAVPGGTEAVRLRLSQDALSKVGELGRPNVKVLLPKDLSRVDELLSSMGLDPVESQKDAERIAAELKVRPRTPTVSAPRTVLPPRSESTPIMVPSPRANASDEPSRVPVPPVLGPPETRVPVASMPGGEKS